MYSWIKSLQTETEIHYLFASRQSNISKNILEADSGLEPGLRVMSPACYQLHQTAICIPAENRTLILRMKTAGPNR